MPLPLLLLLTALPTLQGPAPVNPAPVTDAQAVLDAARAKRTAVMAARAAHVQAGKNTKDFRGDCARELADLEARLTTEQRPPVRSALLVSRLFHLQLAKQAPDPAFVNRIHSEVPPTDAAWSLDPGLLTSLWEDGPATWDVYVAMARTAHPDPAVRRPLLFDYFWERLDAKDDATWKPAYATLQTEFAGSREAKQAKGIYDAEQKTPIGGVAPAFSLTALGDAKTTYTLAGFQGRFLLIDFWATWCPPCRAEMPNMHAAWARFKAKPFDILSLSFDRKIEHIAPYRAQAATPMPWKHAFIEGGFLNSISDVYGVKGIPKPLLIGPDGKIVASGSELKGANLQKTLERFLGK